MRTEVTFTYKNHRGEISVRLIRPIMIAFGSNEYHPEPQWLLHAFDLNKEDERTFAMKDIKDWEPVS
jgi:predicted DNA-binding transcriptional regulator YafY